MAGFGLDSLLQEVGNLIGLNTQVGNQVQAKSAEAAGITRESAELTTQSGELAAAANRIARMGELQAQQANLAAAKAAGAAIGQDGDILTAALQKLREDTLKYDAAQRKYSEIEANADLINNPLGWLRGLVQGDQARAQAEQARAVLEGSAAQVQTLNAATQQSVATQNAIKQTLTEKSIQDLQQAEMMAAAAKANELQADALKIEVGGLTALQNMGAENFRAMVQGYNLITDAEERAANRKFREMQFEEMSALRQARLGKEEYYKEQTAYINAFLKSVDKPPVTSDQVKIGLESNAESAQGWKKLYEQGYRLVNQNGDPAGVYGETPSEVFATLNAYQVKLPDTAQPLFKNVIRSAAAEVEELLRADRTLTDDETRQREFKRLLDERAIEKYQQLGKDIKAGTDNPHQIPDMATLLEAHPELANTEFAEFVVKPLIQAGVTEFDVNKVAPVAASLVKEGKVTSSQMADQIADFVHKGVDIRNATNGARLLGLPTANVYAASVDSLQRTTMQVIGDFLPYTPIAPLSIAGAQRNLNEFLVGAPEVGTTFRSGKEHNPANWASSKDVNFQLNAMLARGVADDILKKE